MFKLKPALFVLLICAICFLISVISSYASEESLTITTYYPSPYGSYRELRSQMMAIGTNYYSASYTCWPGGSCTYPIPAAASLIVEGNVGIGTTNPLTKLSVGGDGYNSGIAIYGNGDSYGVYGESAGASGVSGVQGNGRLNGVYGYSSSGKGVYGSSNSGIGGYFSSQGTGYALITGAGNVGIGTTNPGTNKLQVNGKIQAIGGDICTDQGGGKCLSAAGGETLSCTTVTCDSSYSCVATCPADRVVTGCNNYGFYSVNSVGVSYFVGNGCTGGSFDNDTRVVVQARCCKIQ